MSVRHQEKGVLVVFEMNESLDNGSMHREKRNKQGVLGGVLGKCARTPHPGKQCTAFGRRTGFKETDNIGTESGIPGNGLLVRSIKVIVPSIRLQIRKRILDTMSLIDRTNKEKRYFWAPKRKPVF